MSRLVPGVPPVKGRHTGWGKASPKRRPPTWRSVVLVLMQMVVSGQQDRECYTIGRRCCPYSPPSNFKMTIVEDIKHAVGLDGPSNRKTAPASSLPTSSGQRRPLQYHSALSRANDIAYQTSNADSTLEQPPQGLKCPTPSFPFPTETPAHTSSSL